MKRFKNNVITVVLQSRLLYTVLTHLKSFHRSIHAEDV
jgi:hypothetical protein